MSRLLLVAGEASADVHAAAVLKELRRLRPDLDVAGIGGDLSAAQGMRTLVHCRDLGVMGFSDVLASLGRLWRALRTCVRDVIHRDVKVALLLDFADFNLRLAARLKARGIRVVYFISPKTWVWRSGRSRQIAQRVDRHLVIFPFEEPYFRARGVHAEYVGNPTLDELWSSPERTQARAALGIPAEARVVALLPGSRAGEIRRHLLPMLAAARQMRMAHPELRFLLPRAATIDETLLMPARAVAAELGLTEVDGHAPEVVAAADVAVVASGTATLETALVGTPQVAVYRSSGLNWLIFKYLVRTPFVSLVNILMGRAVITELLQHRMTPENMAREVLRLLQPEPADEQRRAFSELRKSLGAPGAAKRVAAVVDDELRRVSA